MPLLAFALPARARTEHRYDPQGRAAGRAETRGGRTRFYDAQGRSTGRAETRDSVNRFYDAQGRGAGRSETRDGTTRFYDARGRAAGRAEPGGLGIHRLYDRAGVHRWHSRNTYARS